MAFRTDETFKLLKNSHEKYLKTSHRILNCSTYLAHNTTPKGLHINLTPNIGNTGKRFQQRWDQILENRQHMLLKLCLSADLSKLNLLERTISDNTNRLSSKLNSDEFENSKQILSHYNNKLTNKLQLKQHKKFIRDKIPIDSPHVSGRCKDLLDTSHGPQYADNSSYTLPVVPKPHKRDRNRRYKRRNEKKQSTTEPTPYQVTAETPKEVLNLSNYPLSDSDLSLLSKGLTFCPTPRDINERQVREDVRIFFRDLGRKEYFNRKDKKLNDIEEEDSETDSDSDESASDGYQPVRLKQKSDWEPGPSKCGALEAYIDAVEEDVERLLSNNQGRVKDNLSKEERQSIQSLKNNDSIVIKKADKGSTIVVQNKADYIQKASDQLSNSSFYTKLDRDPTTKFTGRIKDTLQEMLDSRDLDPEAFSYLQPDDPRPGQFYLLPKIHKDGIPGRPIVSAIGHHTEKISEFLDYHLRHHVEKLPSFLKDTTDYLNKTPSSNLPDGTLLVTMDVTSLYTNIPHDEGIAACKKVWDSRRVKMPSTESLVKLLEHTLQLNNFMFNGEHYLQINGTSMGTKMAPSYANIFMDDLEQRLLSQASFKPFSWLRYIDDIEMKWTEGRDKLDQFITFANSFHPTIKFTVEISESTNTFLDTQSTLKDGNITFDLYTKPTDSHLYLRPDSCHPPHVFKGIQKGLATRLRRNCSTDQLYRKRSAELKAKLCNRGYKAQSVQKAVSEVGAKDRANLLEYKTKSIVSRVHLVTTYHPAVSGLSSVLRKHLPTLHKSERMHKAIPVPPMVAFRKPRSIKDHIVRSWQSTPYRLFRNLYWQEM